MPKILITEDTLPLIIQHIDLWKGKLTWDLLCKKIAAELGVDSVTRQALSSNDEIKDAYTKRKNSLREEKDEPVVTSDSEDGDVTVEYLKDKVKKLEAENARLHELNERYKKRFVIWLHNAYQRGMNVSSLEDAARVLNEPLVEIKRKTESS